MTEKRLSIVRLILVPSIITLAVTLLRLAGELEEWPKIFFNPEPGGFLAIVGIVWLVPIFGIYFAMKLAGAGQGPAGVGRAIGLAALGVILMAAGYALLSQAKEHRMRYLILMWGLTALGAALQFVAWPALFKVLLAYGYAARIPVAIIMFIATQNLWVSHYNAVSVDSPMDSMTQYGLFGLIPQLVWWVSFTIIVGMLCGSIAAVFVSRGQPAASRSAI